MHLAALVVVPVLGLLACAAWIVRDATTDASAARSARTAALALGELETADAAVERQVLPLMTLAALDDPTAITAFAGDDASHAVVRAQAEQQLAAAHRASTRALAAVPAGTRWAVTAAAARRQLKALRLAGEQDYLSGADLFAAYEGVEDRLGRAQRDAAEAIAAATVSPRTTCSFVDVQHAADLARAGSRTVPLYLGSLPELRTFVLGPAPTPAAVSHQRHQLGSALTQYASARDVEVQPALRAAWGRTLASPAVEAVDRVLPNPGGTAAPLTSAQLQTMLADSVGRDEVFTALVERAVAAGSRDATTDASAAQGRRDTAAALSLALVVLTLVAAATIGRRTTRALGTLAADAQQVSRGLLDVGEHRDHGPREVRTVSAAMRSTVASLRRVQQQAATVARGDLDSDLLGDPVPGPLGEVVHASVQQMVTAVRAREELQEALAHQASHDHLTGLANRAQALRSIGAALHRAQRRGTTTGLLFVDLDGFKAVNDAFGHATGDEVLRLTARRLVEQVRAGDTVARLGGDEFVALVEDVDSEQGLVELAERLVQAVSAPLRVGAAGARELSVGASIGVGLSRDGSTRAETLLAEADAAAYRAKQAGRGRAELFDDGLRAALSAQAELEAAIASALVAGEMRLYYQPVVDAGDGGLRGFEALVRWDRPGHGIVAPDAFIPVAERSTLVCDLDRWVLTEATRQLAEWRAGGGPALTMAVNVSGRHLRDPRVVEDVAGALAASGLPAHLLVLEVTETVLLDDPAAFEHLGALRALGVTVAIDDFGTGYTSIGQLRHMPVDTLKIDRSFVASADPAEQGLVSLIIQAAHAFGLTVVAEGVEEPEQLDRLRDDACDHVQGYLLARPMPAADAAVLAQPA